MYTLSVQINDEAAVIALHIVIDGAASMVAGAEELQVLVLALGVRPTAHVQRLP